jgi:hypothetical protein
VTDCADESAAGLRPVLDLSVLLPLAGAADEEDDEPLGGDPACWAHLFEDDEDGQPAS